MLYRIMNGVALKVLFHTRKIFLFLSLTPTILAESYEYTLFLYQAMIDEFVNTIVTRILHYKKILEI